MKLRKKVMEIKAFKMFFTMGILFIIIGLGIFFKIEYDEYIEEKNIQNISSQLIIQIEEKEEVVVETEEIVINNPIIQEEVFEPRKETAGILINGKEYIGYIEIPSRNIQWPILAYYNDNDVKMAPALYYGNIDDGAVICGHNYKSHFAHLHYLKIGDIVNFTDTNNETIEYVVDKIEILKPSQIADMTLTDYALTLFTCTTGGEERLTLRLSKNNK